MEKVNLILPFTFSLEKLLTVLNEEANGGYM